MPAGWHIVLSRDDTVLASADGAPPSWIGSQLAECDAPDDVKEAGRRLLSGMRESASSVSATVFLESAQQTLHLTIVEALPVRRKPTDLRALLNSALEVLQRQAKAFDVSLRVVVHDQAPPLVSLDAEKTAWVATVLAGNALRYVRHGSQVMPGGSITVRATYDSTISAVALEVQDDGAGIPADRLPLLFKTGADGRSVGVGLLMVRDVVAAHGGHIEVESDTAAFGRGTTIRLTLPVW